MHGELRTAHLAAAHLAAVGSKSLEHGHDRKYKDEPNYPGYYAEERLALDNIIITHWGINILLFV